MRQIFVTISVFLFTSLSLAAQQSQSDFSENALQPIIERLRPDDRGVVWQAQCSTTSAGVCRTIYSSCRTIEQNERNLTGSSNRRCLEDFRVCMASCGG